MRYIADTNVISVLMSPLPNQPVIDWFWDHEGDIYITSITVKELFYGVFRLPEGRRKKSLYDAVTAIVKDCSDKVLGLDAFSGYLCAEMHADAIAQGLTPDIEDLMIAAIAKRNGCVLATRNVKDFAYLDIDLVNPSEP